MKWSYNKRISERMKPNPRTSETDPLSFSTLQVGKGFIGLTICPGKKGASIYGNDWHRDIDSDIRAIANWGASAVVTIMTDDELQFLGVGNLGLYVAKYGMEWYQIPVPDTTAPNYETLEQWDYIRRRIHSRLNREEKIIIHCRGGLGRSGTLAAKLLMDKGLTCREAIERVRVTRPGAIETAEQELYLRHSD